MTLAVSKVSLTADGSTPWYQVQGGEAQFGHNVVLAAKGSLGGGTLKVEIGLQDPAIPAPTDFINLVNSLGLGLAQTGLILPPGSRIRFTLTGSSGPSVDTYILE
jgi:hypothetical protein